MAEEGQAPRKPFKTISLEDRLRESQYDKISDKGNTAPPSPSSQNDDLRTVKNAPAIPPTDKDKQSPKVNERGEPQDKSGQSPDVEGRPLQDKELQAPELNETTLTFERESQSPEVYGIPTSQDKNSNDINLPQSQLTLPKEGAILKDTINLAEKTSPILKTLVESPQAQIDPPREFSTKPLTNSTRPTGFTDFASSISLEDRLKQSSVTQTKHLPQYFLSDLYTGYLTITPFITPTIDNQDIGQLPDFLTAAIDETQNIGELATPSENVLSRQDASVELQTPKSNELVLTGQGTFISNNIVNSFTEPTTPSTSAQLNQGEIELPIFEFTPNQGITENESEPFNDLKIAVLQGMVVENQLIRGSSVEINTEPEEIQIVNFPTPDTGKISSDVFDAGRARAFDNPLAFHGTVELGGDYEADKAQSLNSPEARHGRVELSVNEFLAGRTLAFGSPAVFHGAAIIVPFEQNPEGLLPSAAPSIETTPYTPQANIPLPPDISALNTSKYTDATPIKSAGKQNPGAHRPDVQSAPPTISHAAALKSHRTSTKGILMSIKDTDGRKVVIEPYLTSFSDGFSANWNDLKYAGRQDTMKQFVGSTRSVSFAVMLPSFNKEEVAENMAKLEQIISMCVVGRFVNGGEYIKAPLVKVRIGGLLNHYCAFGSVKWDFDPAEATFAGENSPDEQLPSLLKIQFEGAVLANNQDNLFNAEESGWFAKTWV